MNVSEEMRGMPEPSKSQYLRLIEAMAWRGLASGKQGDWSRIANKAVESQTGADGGAGCDENLHLRYIELDTWGQVFDEFVLPERHPVISAAIHRAADVVFGVIDPSMQALVAVCPEEHLVGMPLASGGGVRSAELLALRQLGSARGSGSASALEAALRAVLAIPGDLGGHARCRPFEVIGMGDVLVRALQGTVPDVYRRVLALAVEHNFYRRCIPDEPVPENLFVEPTWISAPGSLLPFGATWPWVARDLRWMGLGEPSAIEGPWMLPRFEAAIRTASEEEPRLDSPVQPPCGTAHR